MMIQFFNDSINWNYESILTPLIEFLIILFIVLFMTFLYIKLRTVPAITLFYFIGIIACITSIRSYTIPLTPIIQLLAILFMTLIFLYTMFDFNKKRKKYNRGI